MTYANGVQAFYVYDNANHLQVLLYLTHSKLLDYFVYGYDPAGNMTSASDSNSSYTFSYDGDFRLTQTKISYPGFSALGTVTLSYGYDSYANRTSMTDSLGGNLSYGYNANNQLTSLFYNQTGAGFGLTFAYDTSNRLSTITFNTSGGHQFSGTYAYDTYNRLTGITYKDSTAQSTLATFSYGYNAASQITSYSGPDGSLTYGYDHAGQLTSVSGAHNESFGYDKNGNRNTAGYFIGPTNEMTSDAAGNTLTYDKDGNLATKTDSSNNVWTYTFDVLNRLTQVVEKNSGGTTLLTENLTYDVFNNLISTSVNGTVQRWTVFDGQNPYMDVNTSGSVTQRFIMDPTVLDKFFATVSASGTIDWLLTDNLGSVREVVCSNGTVLDQITYGAFGNILSQTSPSNAPRFLYAGGEWDGNLGLYHFGARWDDPIDGRWISQDPSGFEAGDANLYRYVNNKPTQEVDPSGLEGFESRLARQDLRRGLAAAPTFQQLLNNPQVNEALRRAWEDSNPNAPPVLAGRPGSLKREQGGWILWNGVTRQIVIVRVPAGRRDGLPEIGSSPAGAGEITLAWFHTHPNTRAEGYSADASPADIAFTRSVGVPGIIETHEGRKTIQP
jgi:RHS repeat-associated protein